MATWDTLDDRVRVFEAARRRGACMDRTHTAGRRCDISCFAEHQLDAVGCAGHARMVRRVILCGGMTKITRNEAWITLRTKKRSLHRQVAIFCMEHQRVELEENLRRALGACSECPHITPEFWALSRRKQGRLDHTALVR